MADDDTVGKRILFDPATLERAQGAASERGMSLHRLVNLAAEHFCDRLLPADEIVWTRDVAELGEVHFHSATQFAPDPQDA